MIPAAYVTRRDQWSRELDPEAPLGPAGQRIEPALVDRATALSDIERRIGWLRELERQGEKQMGSDLEHLDRGLASLRELSRRTGHRGPT